VKTIQGKDNELRKAYANNEQLEKDKQAFLGQLNEKE
jgi:hypothetical protein